jgi:hypothetical protein
MRIVFLVATGLFVLRETETQRFYEQNNLGASVALFLSELS